MSGGLALAAKNLLFTLVVPGSVAGLLPWAMARGKTPASGAGLVLAVFLFALGAALYAWCLWDFAAFGRGTPAPIAAPRRLVVRGLYRLVRNPMYLGVLTVLAGWALLYRSLALALYGLGVAALFNLFVFGYEEPHLRRLFGADYEAYCRRTGRWLPRLRGADGLAALGPSPGRVASLSGREEEKKWPPRR